MTTHTDPDWLAIGRDRYLRDPEFHALVNVLVQERIDDELRQRTELLGVLADRSDSLPEWAQEWLAPWRTARVDQRRSERRP